MTADAVEPRAIEAEFVRACRSDFGDEWMRTHKGALRRVEGHIYYCDDPVCDCSQPSVVAVFDNATARPGVVRVALWEGAFRTNGEEGAEDELRAVRAAMDATGSDLASRIDWTVLDA